LRTRREYFAFVLILIASLIFGAAVSAQNTTTDSADAAAAVAAAATAATLSLVCFAFWFVVNIIILIWVYRDAKAHGANPVLWALIVFFTGVIGLILYLLLGRKSAVPPARI
jgi:apolipoprotein N-acyltransferase